ncbi:MAG: hypothetical protein WDM88_05735 [Galbitalea sp.]
MRGRLRATVSGFLTGSNVRVWIFSTPVNAAKLLVLSDTKARADFVLPKSIRPGNHTIVASGMTADGKAVTLRIGLRVLPLPAPLGGCLCCGMAVVVRDSRGNHHRVLHLHALAAPSSRRRGRRVGLRSHRSLSSSTASWYRVLVE